MVAISVHEHWKNTHQSALIKEHLSLFQNQSIIVPTVLLDSDFRNKLTERVWELQTFRDFFRVHLIQDNKILVRPLGISNGITSSSVKSHSEQEL